MLLVFVPVCFLLATRLLTKEKCLSKADFEKILRVRDLSGIEELLGRPHRVGRWGLGDVKGKALVGTSDYKVHIYRLQVENWPDEPSNLELEIFLVRQGRVHHFSYHNYDSTWSDEVAEWLHRWTGW
jgi:hypothetical protein